MCVNVCVQGWVFLSWYIERNGFRAIMGKPSRILGPALEPVEVWRLMGASCGAWEVLIPVVRLLCETRFGICCYWAGGEGKQQKLKYRGVSLTIWPRSTPSDPNSVVFEVKKLLSCSSGPILASRDWRWCRAPALPRGRGTSRDPLKAHCGLNLAKCSLISYAGLHQLSVMWKVVFWF